MDKRRLVGTDLDVSVVCFGPIRAALKEPGADPRSRAGAEALRAALDCGIDFCGRVEEALDELCCERIAVVQWMWRTRPNEDPPRVALLPQIHDDVVACFEQLRDEGKVGHLWTFPYIAPAGRVALGTGSFGGLIGFFNPVEMEMAELFPALAERDMGFLAIRPLLEGVLTDQRPNQEALAEDDRLKDPKHAPTFRKRAAVAEAFREEIGGSMTRFALRFPLWSPLVASVIVGLNTPWQVEAVAGMMGGVEPRAELLERALASWREGLCAAA